MIVIVICFQTPYVCPRSPFNYTNQLVTFPLLIHPRQHSCSSNTATFLCHKTNANRYIETSIKISQIVFARET